ncbi:MAG TPA: 4'-phosphopantetheinyl transferase superfamily protein [Oxalicibacterium sp.]|nr:4'-phosphopantetheinyl transferase superfamily protein [Oxalicibacterium sp.]
MTLWLTDSRSVDSRTLDSRMDWLSASEAARYRRFIRPQRQRQFLLGRILLRIALAELLGIETSGIALAERPGNAPALIGIVPVPAFSIAHSGHWVACAVSTDTPLGLDIEVRNSERDLAALARQAFSRKEADALAKLDGEARVRTFYELWSRKEAAYKLISTLPTGERHSPHFTTLAHPDLSIVVCSAHAAVRITLRDPLHHLHS